ncbi:MAG: anthranilate phosphoribosyltransferase [Bacteroidales bacterium]|nr:anthranilate phosphoribosyltransferase [Bacteroidales bacterium]MBR5054122.1 anthranilate phosphoribosyltransferase [Bacteroidales bacterium]
MKKYLEQLIEGESLSREQTHEILLGITREQYNDCQIAAFLMALQTKGVTVDELLGLRDGLLETGKRIDLDDYNTLDIVGTGGDGKNTFNISTCSAFVIAGAGYKVTKHGNGASTSVSGASTVLEAHGAKFSADPDVLRRSLEEAGICYFHAPLFAYGMKFVGPVRRALGVPTCFNLLGPLVNPCRPKNSLHGTATQAQQRLYVRAHQKIGDNYGVLTSYDGYDEISLTSGFKLVTPLFEKVFTPKDLGLNYVEPRDIYGGRTAEEAMQIFDSVLEGTATEAQKSVILANAACGMSIMDRNLSVEESIDRCRESLDSGNALAAFKRFLAINS